MRKPYSVQLLLLHLSVLSTLADIPDPTVSYTPVPRNRGPVTLVVEAHPADYANDCHPGHLRVRPESLDMQVSNWRFPPCWLEEDKSPEVDHTQ